MRSSILIFEQLPKVETLLYTGFSQMQRDLYKKTLMRDMSTLQSGNAGSGGKTSKAKLCNIVMQLRKVCNHPYLFDGIEGKYFKSERERSIRVIEAL